MATYTFPHVEITQKALQRRQTVAVESTATKLLAPFVCDRGPINELVAIDTYADFVSTYGSLNYKNQGQEQILNIGNWLANGGRVLACRLSPDELKYYLYAQADATDVETTVETDVMPADAEKIGKIYSTKFVWKIKEADAESYNEKEYVKVILLPEFVSSTKNSTKTRYVPELLVEVHTLNMGEEEILTEDVTKYYYALENVSELAPTDGEAVGYYHNDNNAETYFNFIDSGLEYSDVAYAYEANNYHLKASLVANMTLANILALSDTSTNKTFTTGIYIISPTVPVSDKAAYATCKLEFQNGAFTFDTQARYPGTYYNNIKVNLTTTISRNVPYFTIILQKSENNTVTTLERFSNVSIDNLYEIENSSEYLGYFHILANGTEITSDMVSSQKPLQNAFNALTQQNPNITLAGGRDGSTDIQTFLVDSLTKILSRPLETPFDMLIDPGYSLEVKQDLIKLFCSQSTDINDVVRNDAFLTLTNRVFNGETIGSSTLDNIEEIDPDILRPTSGNIDGVVCDFYNMSIHRNVHKIEDIYSLNGGREVYVPSTYFLAGLYPNNDKKYGVQYPTAGLTRGVVTGSLWIDELPTNAQKQDYYDNHLNYIEKDSRGSYFMSQLTGDVNNTALNKINSVRALLKIKSELTTTARRYLHEFNDRITKNNLLNALNTIMSNWIQNRTLSYGTIAIYDSTDNPSLLDEEVQITSQIKFTGTIDIISFDITIDA